MTLLEALLNLTIMPSLSSPHTAIPNIPEQDILLWIAMAATIYVLVTIFPSIVKISLTWRRSLSVYTISATAQESAPLLHSSSSYTEGATTTSSESPSNNASTSPASAHNIESSLGEWEVLDVEEIQSKPGIHWAVIAFSRALSVFWLTATIYIVLTRYDGSNFRIITSVLTFFNAILIFAAMSICFTDARKIGLRNAVDIERLKNSQRTIAFFAIGYLLLFNIEIYLGNLTPLVLAYVALLIPMGRLQRKPIDGLVPNPEEDSNILSQAMLFWMNPLVEYGYNHKIEAKDVWNASKTELTTTPLQKHKAAIQNYKLSHMGKAPSLFLTLWIVHWPTLAYQLVLVLFDLVLFFSNAYFVFKILKATPEKGQPESYVYWYVAGMFVFAGFRYLVASIESQLVTKLGARIRNVLSALIYEKSLRRAPVAKVTKEDDSKDDTKTSASVGKIVNLMSVDATTIGDWIGYLYTPVMVGLQILICIFSLLYILGWSALPGVVVLIATMFGGGPLASRLNTLYGDMKKAVDKRVSIFNEVVQGIKIIKFFAWEKMFADKIDQLREKEMDLRWKVDIGETLNRMLWYSAPFLTTVTTLGFYTA
ncbi:hypothetical protein HDU97_007517, partial [Phlyctochytrium planicorne]